MLTNWQSYRVCLGRLPESNLSLCKLVLQIVAQGENEEPERRQFRDQVAVKFEYAPVVTQSRSRPTLVVILFTIPLYANIFREL